MTVKKGVRNLLEIAKDAAIAQIHKAPAGARFLLLTNDRLINYQPITADKALNNVNDITVSPVGKSDVQILTTIQSIVQSEGAAGADVYYYSDFQQSTFSARPEASLMKNIKFFGMPVQATDVQNIYIDTAYLLSPVLQTGQNNQIIVHTKNIGKLPKEMPVLQLSVNGQVKSAASLAFNDKNESIDTLNFVVNDANWQKITLSLNDAAVCFDDTFRITARSAPNLSVLVLNEGQPNPYIQAAFRAYNGFRINQQDVNSAPADIKDYNLIILNGVTNFDGIAKLLSTASQQGQSICIFPGKTSNFSALNEGLKQIGDIQITGLDTASQAASSLQQGSSLVKDLFEKIPENVQLPTANWHYMIAGGLSSNQQSILSFRNGDPFLARYMPGKGQIYICATSADLQSGNFPGSYFFVPFLYQMTVQSHGSNIYAITVGKQQPVYLPMNNADERNMVHLYANGIDAIPPQRPNGAGLDIYIDQSVHQPGFYTLAASGSDTTTVALNQDRNESQLNVWNIGMLKNQWNGDNIKWLNVDNAGNAKYTGNAGDFPLWKVCVILALLMLLGESFMLAGSFRKQNIATQ
ncbi:MAG TPA: hypothetical protein VN721_16150 [Flavipsychrobacter sp.]|nr:hypothetical protein [Flavipsychrobacter sp.]